MTIPRQIPAKVYDFLGWQFDIEPIYRRLCMPGAPAYGMSVGVTYSRVVDVAESSLLAFFSNTEVQRSVKEVGDLLQDKRFVDGVAMTEFVMETGVRTLAESYKYLDWEVCNR